MSKRCKYCGAPMRQNQIDCEYCTPPEAITPIVQASEPIETKSGPPTKTWVSIGLVAVYIILAVFLLTFYSAIGTTTVIAIYAIQTGICVAQFIINLKPFGRSNALNSAILLFCSVMWALPIPLLLGLMSITTYMLWADYFFIVLVVLIVAAVINFIIFLSKII